MTDRGRLRLLFTVLFALHLFVLFPGFLSTQDFAEQNRELPFAPPTRLHFARPDGSWGVRPFVYAWKDSIALDGTYEEDQSQIFPLRFFGKGTSYTVFGVLNCHTHLLTVDPPGHLFLLGTDDFGRDEFSRLLYGGRISVLAGLMGTAIAIAVGSLAGLISGYFGKWIDAIVMRLVELFMALPWLYLLFAVRALLPLHIKTTYTFLLLVAVIGLVGWAHPARLVRGIVLSAKERNFVLASRAMGGSSLHILKTHILPQTYRVILTTAALLVPQFILAEVTLSFLGLGVGEPIPSWGNLLAELQKYNVLTQYWWLYAPGVALFVIFLAYQWASSVFQRKTATVNL